LLNRISCIPNRKSKQHIPPKRWHFSTKLHGVMSQNTVIFTCTAVRTSTRTLNNKVTLKISYNLFNTKTFFKEVLRVTLHSARSLYGRQRVCIAVFRGRRLLEESLVLPPAAVYCDALSTTVNSKLEF
jgi:hypothetical protein